RSAVFGISGSLTKTFTIAAQASDASRWVRASPQKKLKLKIDNLRGQLNKLFFLIINRQLMVSIKIN
ncbi:MAG: hypothetical protein MPJ52_06150, partial [Alphaproteobacteria bacterium]|nr:hypothetical protein [Alphaproteobacteria bacterium]